MATLFKKKEDVKLPKVLEATLLSEEEFEMCQEYIKSNIEFEPACWYLRTPAENGEICLAAGRGLDDPTPPDYEDTQSGPFDMMLMGTGIRPVLRLETDELSDGTKLNPGDEIRINKWCQINFTYISNNLLLADRYIYDESLTGYDTFGIFDKSTNIYEQSEAKQKVDAWFEKMIKPHL